MLIVIMSGGIDLSVGPVVALAGILVSGLQMKMPLYIAIPIAIATGGLVGLANGFMISKFKLQPFIVTLATLGIIPRGDLCLLGNTHYPHRPHFSKYSGQFPFWGHSGACHHHAGHLCRLLVLCQPDYSR